MKEFKVMVNLRFEKTITVELEESERTDLEEEEVAEQKAMDMIHEMTSKEYEEFLSSCQMDGYAIAMTMEEKVRSAIDRFDPYVLLPGEDAPYDEYYGESRRILEKIKQDMAKEEIADIIAKEFSRSFNTDFTRERCMLPAEEIYDYLQA